MESGRQGRDFLDWFQKLLDERRARQERELAEAPYRAVLKAVLAEAKAIREEAGRATGRE